MVEGMTDQELIILGIVLTKCLVLNDVPMDLSVYSFQKVVKDAVQKT